MLGTTRPGVSPHLGLWMVEGMRTLTTGCGHGGLTTTWICFEPWFFHFCVSFGKLTLTVNLFLGPLCPMTAGTQVAGTTCARLGPRVGSRSLWELLVERWVGLWDTASGLELAELSLSSAGDRAEGKASNRKKPGSPGSRALSHCNAASDTKRAFSKYLMSGDSASKSYSKTRSPNSSHCLPGPAVLFLAERAQMWHAVSF